VGNIGIVFPWCSPSACTFAEPARFGPVALPAGTAVTYFDRYPGTFKLPPRGASVDAFGLSLPAGTEGSFCYRKQALEHLSVNRTAYVVIGGVKLTGWIDFDCGSFRSGQLFEDMGTGDSTANGCRVKTSLRRMASRDAGIRDAVGHRLADIAPRPHRRSQSARSFRGIAEPGIRATGLVSYAAGHRLKIWKGSSLRLGRSRANDAYRAHSGRSARPPSLAQHTLCVRRQRRSAHLSASVPSRGGIYPPQTVTLPPPWPSRIGGRMPCQTSFSIRHG
jgi:hypothetical protein